MAKLIGKLTKIGKNDFGGIVIQLDGNAEVSVWEDKAVYAAPFLSTLKLMSEVSLPVVGYKGKTQLDMSVIGEPESSKGKKFLSTLKPFYSKKKDKDDEMAGGATHSEFPNEQDRG